MLSLRFYYALKPFLPWRVRMGLRRISAGRKRKQFAAVWPINESTKQPPPGWAGWPEGRKFAFVITHDVEGPEGLAKCRQLAELEMAHGVRSCFNFIPEGPYQVPPELRAWLVENGFEVGVHDLNHDGKLFASQRGFIAKAQRINHYLRTWQAQGYRSGFMLRNLDWLHELAIGYDSSTFDTDPFEPQPDGAGTIFPYWIPSPPAPDNKASAPQLSAQPSALSPQPSVPPQGGGYVELPYTLPQDSTLFLLLQEKSPEIWLRKLDWITSHGGMALVNVHPDYVSFSGTPGNEREYPATFYTELLRYVSQHHAGKSWNPLPRDLAYWFRQHQHPDKKTPDFAARSTSPLASSGIKVKNPPLQGKRAAMIQFSYYPFDPRPRRAAEALIEAGMEVEVLCLTESDDEPRHEQVGSVNVTRSMVHRRRGTSKWLYFSQYTSFFISASWFLTRRSLRRRYDIVHVHNMPDFLVFAALIPRLRGAKVILDLHDPMPELLVSISDMNPAGWQVKLLLLLERWSIAFAHLVLTPNAAFRNLFVSRGCPPGKIEIVMNSPEEKIFNPATIPPASVGPGDQEVFRIMHHGLIAHRHGVDLLVEAVARLRPTIPGVRLDIYGGHTPFLDFVLATADRLGVADIVTYHGEKTHHEIAHAILEADVGVVPNRRSDFTDQNFPTRIFEYQAMGCSVIAPATHGIQDYFTPEQLQMFKPGDVDDLTAHILLVRNDPAAARAILERGRLVYREHLWSMEKARLLGHVGNLVQKLRPKRICMITHSFYEVDNRVTRYAEALAARGDHVDVLALRRGLGLAPEETIEGVHVFRIQDRFGKTEKSLWSYLWPSLRFLIVTSWWVSRRQMRERYDLMHVHNIPDFLVFASGYPKLTGTRVILDIHDIVPEFFGSKFGQKRKAAMILLLWMERWSARFADHIIISNHLWLDLYATRTRTSDRCSVFINNVNARVFQPRLRTRHDDRLIVLFPGGLQWHQGLDIALRAFVRVHRELPQAEFHIYGDGNMKPALLQLTTELGLDGVVRFFDPVRITEIAQVMANADLGVVPKRADSFGNEAYSTKIMEFMSVGVPVVVSRTRIDQFYFNDSVVKFFESGSAEALAEAMLEVLRDPALREQLRRNASAYAQQHSWESRKGDYLRLVDTVK